jgi:hypothetical protein
MMRDNYPEVFFALKGVGGRVLKTFSKRFQVGQNPGDLANLGCYMRRPQSLIRRVIEF